jgi:RNA recognition motif-containing protein
MTMDWPERMVDAWLKLEREEGTLESYLRANMEIEKIKGKIQKRRLKEAQALGASGQAGAATATMPTRSAPERKRKFEGTNDAASFKKPRTKAAAAPPAAPAEYHGTDAVKSKRTVFASNLPVGTTEGELRLFFADCGDIDDVRIVESTNANGRPNVYAYIEFNEAVDIATAIAKDGQSFKVAASPYPRPMFVKEYKERAPVDKKALFVSRLPKNMKMEDLRELFENVIHDRIT